jgi:hypothetical protein
MNKTRNMKNKIFAIPAAATATPENPKSAATRATKKKPKAQRNISSSLFSSFRLDQSQKEITIRERWLPAISNSRFLGLSESSNHTQEA